MYDVDISHYLKERLVETLISNYPESIISVLDKEKPEKRPKKMMYDVDISHYSKERLVETLISNYPENIISVLD